MSYDKIIEDYVRYFTTKHKVWGLGDKYFHGLFNNQKEVIKRLVYNVDKVMIILNKHPQLFHNKRLLDFGCGSGEHSYIFSHICSEVDCYDPEPSQKNLLKYLFSNTNNFRVLEESEYYYNSYDTVFISGVLECVPDYCNWFVDTVERLDCSFIVLIFAPDVDRKVTSVREYRLDNSPLQTTTNEEELLKYTRHLTLFDRFEFITRENRFILEDNKINDHKKVVHIYQKK